MKLTLKTIIAILLVALIVVLVSFLVIRHNKNHGLKIVDPRIRIQELVTNLKKESFKESIDNSIGSESQYLYPGYNPVSPRILADVFYALSSRRSIKLIQKIESLPKLEAEANCGLFFSTVFQAHSNAFQAILKRDADTNAPPSKHSVNCTKWALGTAMFATANIGRLDILSAQMDEMDQFQRTMEPVIQQRMAINPNGVAFILEFANPDNEFLVNILYLAAVRSGNADILMQASEACRSAQMDKFELPIMPWDANKTWFENKMKNWPGVTFAGKDISISSKAAKNYTMFDWRIEGAVNTRLQKELILKLKSIVFR